VGLLDARAPPGAARKSRRPRQSLRHRQLYRGRQRCRRHVQNREGSRRSRAAPAKAPYLIEAKTFRRMGHAQHDPAEYVPKDMRAYWEARDPILLYEKISHIRKAFRHQGQKGNRRQDRRLLQKERDFAESSPMPPRNLPPKAFTAPETIVTKFQAKWERDMREVMPPKSSVPAVWTVEGFGAGKGSSGGIAPIHFGDTSATTEKAENEEDSRLSPRQKLSRKRNPPRTATVAAGSRKARR